MIRHLKKIHHHVKKALGIGQEPKRPRLITDYEHEPYEGTGEPREQKPKVKPCPPPVVNKYKKGNTIVVEISESEEFFKQGGILELEVPDEKVKKSRKRKSV